MKFETTLMCPVCKSFLWFEEEEGRYANVRLYCPGCGLAVRIPKLVAARYLVAARRRRVLGHVAVEDRVLAFSRVIDKLYDALVEQAYYAKRSRSRGKK